MNGISQPPTMSYEHKKKKKKNRQTSQFDFCTVQNTHSQSSKCNEPTKWDFKHWLIPMKWRRKYYDAYTIANKTEADVDTVSPFADEMMRNNRVYPKPRDI